MAHADAALSNLLPGQQAPWLLKHSTGDVIAYFHLVEDEEFAGQIGIQVDVSGRHYHEDAAVLGVLHELRNLLGGEISDDL